MDTSAAGTERLFTGQIEDADAGLNFYNARYLETGIGRFISPDSIIPNPSDPRDHNRYTYVRNNPLKYTDPSGNIVCGGVCIAISIAAASATLGAGLDMSLQKVQGATLDTMNWGSVTVSASLSVIGGQGLVLANYLFKGAKLAVAAFAINGTISVAKNEINVLQGGERPSREQASIEFAVSGATGTYFKPAAKLITQNLVDDVVIDAAEVFIGDVATEVIIDVIENGFDTRPAPSVVPERLPSPSESKPARSGFSWGYHSGEDLWR